MLSLRVPLASFLLLAPLALACGGAQGAAGDPQTPGGGTTSDAGASADVPATVPTAQATTTTSDLADGGPGTKLTPSDAPAGDATPAKPSEPGRSAKDIQAMVMAHRDDARACYDKGLAQHPGLEGNLDVKWVIDPTGLVKDAVIDESKSDIHDGAIGNCVVAVVQKLRFSVSAKGFETRAHYPFNFHPKNNTTAAPGGAK